MTKPRKIPDAGDFFIRAVTAVLPALGLFTDFHQAFKIGALISSAAFFTALFFKITATAFPEKLKTPALLLTLFTAAQSAWYLAGLPPFWILSVWLILPQSEETGQKVSAVFASALSFWIILSFLGMARSLGHHFNISFLLQPSGSFLTLTLFLLVWLLQPGRIKQEAAA